MEQDTHDTQPVYWVYGPVLAQDGREVWQVVRFRAHSSGIDAVLGEALTREHAQAQADELNKVLDELEHQLKARLA